MARINEQLSKDIVAYFGSSGSGKSHNMKKDIAGDKRVMVFDPEGEYAKEGFTAFQAPADLIAFLKKNHLRDWRITFEANGPAMFDLWCRLVWSQAHADCPLTAVADELAGVTTTSKALPSWHRLVTRGRKYGVRIRAASIAPAEIDKTLLRVRSGMWIGMLERPADRQYLAAETGIPVAELDALRGEPHWDAIVSLPGKNWKKIPGQ